MPKRSSKPKQDVNQLAASILAKAIEELPTQTEQAPAADEISRVMAAMGRRGGLLGGAARAKSLTKAERVAIASKAAKTRWKKRK